MQRRDALHPTWLAQRFIISPMSRLLWTVLLLALISFALAVDQPSEQSGLHHGVGVGAGTHPQEIPTISNGEQQTHTELRYEAQFVSVSGTQFEKRQSGDRAQLVNNVGTRDEIQPGDTMFFVFSSNGGGEPTNPESRSVPPVSSQETTESNIEQLSELRRRQEGTNEVFLTLSICRQPIASSDSTIGAPPGLELYISTSEACSPSLELDDENQIRIPTIEGYAQYNVTRNEDVCIAVHAAETPGFSGSYTFEVAASIDMFYADYHDYSSLHLLDTDDEAGLFITSNLTDSDQAAWLESGSPFSIFIHPSTDPPILGLMRSYCGLNSTAQIRGNTGRNDSVEVGMTTMRAPNTDMSVKQQFFVPGLQANSQYYAFLGLPSNYSASGSPTSGGTLWRRIQFDTKAERNCRLLYNLTFCSNVAYSVPSNHTITTQDLRNIYDNHAESYMLNFTHSLAQVACDAEPDALYSLATNCTNCTDAYRNWLCAVTIPRCTDFSATEPFLQPRYILSSSLNDETPPSNLTEDERNSDDFQSSRLALIDEEIFPGPYKEILPCGSLCYGLVQACPASLGFGCPDDDPRAGYNRSYQNHGGTQKTPMCNLPGAIFIENGGFRFSSSLWVLLSTIIFVALEI